MAVVSPVEVSKLSYMDRRVDSLSFWAPEARCEASTVIGHHNPQLELASCGEPHAIVAHGPQGSLFCFHSAKPKTLELGMWDATTACPAPSHATRPPIVGIVRDGFPLYSPIHLLTAFQFNLRSWCCFLSERAPVFIPRMWPLHWKLGVWQYIPTVQQLLICGARLQVLG